MDIFLALVLVVAFVLVTAQFVNMQQQLNILKKERDALKQAYNKSKLGK